MSSPTIPTRFPVLLNFNLNYPSQLIRFAVKALEKFEATPGCSVNMMNWHTQHEDKEGKQVCYACLAGAAAVELACISADHPAFWGVGLTAQRVLLADRANVYLLVMEDLEYALNDARQGLIAQMFSRMSLPRACVPPTVWGVVPVDYEEDPEAFKRDMLIIAARLEEAGF